MGDRDQLDAFMMLARTMKGEKNVIEHMEAEGQERAIRNTMMARKMLPSKEDWEQLGFVFIDIPDDDVLCRAILPEGWSIKETGHSMWSEIIDKNGKKRASMFYKASFYDRSAYMSLTCRYGICESYVGDDHRTTEVYFGNAEEKLFVAGQAYTPESSTREERLAKYDEVDKLKAIAKQFGDINYPGWEDVHAYWDKEKEVSHDLSKK